MRLTQQRAARGARGWSPGRGEKIWVQEPSFWLQGRSHDLPRVPLRAVGTDSGSL